MYMVNKGLCIGIHIFIIIFVWNQSYILDTPVITNGNKHNILFHMHGVPLSRNLHSDQPFMKFNPVLKQPI